MTRAFRNAVLAAAGVVLGAMMVPGAVAARDRGDGCYGKGECNRHIYRRSDNGCGGSGNCREGRRHYRPQVYGCGGPGECRNGRTYVRRQVRPYYENRRYEGYRDPYDGYGFQTYGDDY